MVAEALGLDLVEWQPKDAKIKVEPSPEQVFNLSRIKSLLGGWLTDGSLIVVDGRSPDGKAVKCVGVGKPAPLPDEHGSAAEE